MIPASFGGFISICATHLDATRRKPVGSSELVVDDGSPKAQDTVRRLSTSAILPDPSTRVA